MLIGGTTVPGRHLERLGATWSPAPRRSLRRGAVEVSVPGLPSWRWRPRPVAVRAGDPVDLGTPKQRALVAALALSRGWPVSVDAIVDLLWGDHPPAGVTATLQAYVVGAAAGRSSRTGRAAPRPRCW